jgi:CRISPR-associated DxTHG motif protein
LVEQRPPSIAGATFVALKKLMHSTNDTLFQRYSSRLQAPIFSALLSQESRRVEATLIRTGISIQIRFAYEKPLLTTLSERDITVDRTHGFRFFPLRGDGLTRRCTTAQGNSQQARHDDFGHFRFPQRNRRSEMTTSSRTAYPMSAYHCTGGDGLYSAPYIQSCAGVSQNGNWPLPAANRPQLLIDNNAQPGPTSVLRSAGTKLTSLIGPRAILDLT